MLGPESLVHFVGQSKRMVKKLLAIPRRLYWVTKEVFSTRSSQYIIENNTMPITDSTETFVAKTFGFLLFTIGQLWTQNLQAKCLCWASNIWQSLYAKGLKLFSLFSSCFCVFHTSVVNPTRSFSIFPIWLSCENGWYYPKSFRLQQLLVSYCVYCIGLFKGNRPVDIHFTNHLHRLLCSCRELITLIIHEWTAVELSPIVCLIKMSEDGIHVACSYMRLANICYLQAHASGMYLSFAVTCTWQIL